MLQIDVSEIGQRRAAAAPGRRNHGQAPPPPGVERAAWHHRLVTSCPMSARKKAIATSFTQNAIACENRK